MSSASVLGVFHKGT